MPYKRPTPNPALASQTPPLAPPPLAQNIFKRFRVAGTTRTLHDDLLVSGGSENLEWRRLAKAAEGKALKIRSAAARKLAGMALDFAEGEASEALDKHLGSGKRMRHSGQETQGVRLRCYVPRISQVTDHVTLPRCPHLCRARIAIMMWFIFKSVYFDISILVTFAGGYYGCTTKLSFFCDQG